MSDINEELNRLRKEAKYLSEEVVVLKTLTNGHSKGFMTVHNKLTMLEEQVEITNKRLDEVIKFVGFNKEPDKKKVVKKKPVKKKVKIKKGKEMSL